MTKIYQKSYLEFMSLGQPTTESKETICCLLKKKSGRQNLRENYVFIANLKLIRKKQKFNYTIKIKYLLSNLKYAIFKFQNFFKLLILPNKIT